MRFKHSGVKGHDVAQSLSPSPAQLATSPSGGPLDEPERARLYRERAAEMVGLADAMEVGQRRMMLAIAAMYQRLADELEREES